MELLERERGGRVEGRERGGEKERDCEVTILAWSR